MLPIGGYCKDETGKRKFSKGPEGKGKGDPPGKKGRVSVSPLKKGLETYFAGPLCKASYSRVKRFPGIMGITGFTITRTFKEAE